MASGKTLTISVMDPPYESATTTTVLRIVDAALRKGHNVNVFAYEGAVALPLKTQAPHPNPVKGTTVEEQRHPTTSGFISALFEAAQANGAKLDWVNCGLCVDERGATEWVDGVRRGGPGDFAKFAQESTNTVVIGTR
ncbi:MAG TPA: DsrE family protein [Chloroflexota bacterium]|nr:DsrE family protein [Chloroflexota bacterium]